MTTTNLEYDDPLPDDEFIVRYCRKYSWKLKNDGRRTIEAKAFRSGRDPLADISVNWMGYFGRNDSKSLNGVCETTTYNGINRDGLFAKLNTTDIKKIYIESLGRKLITKYRPECDGQNPSHAEICPPGDDVFKALARLASEHGTILEVPENHR